MSTKYTYLLYLYIIIKDKLTNYKIYTYLKISCLNEDLNNNNNNNNA